MTDQPKPSPEALAAADAICKRHGMLPGGYMRDSLAEALEAFAAKRPGPITTESESAAIVWAVEWAFKRVLRREDAPMSWDAGWPGYKAQALIDWATSKASPPTVGTCLGVPITAAERDAISKDGP